MEPVLLWVPWLGFSIKMTKDDIIRMAREARFEQIAGDDWVCFTEEIERFAALVAAHALANIDPSKLMSYQEGYEAGRTAERERLLSTTIHSCHANCQRFACVQTRKAVEAEREACAKLCDEMERRAEGTECCKWPTPADCAYAIRARG